MTTQTQDLSQTLVLSDSQFAPSIVEDSQPMSEMAPDSEVFEFYGQEVSATQVYNHLRKWRSRWIQVSKLRDLSGASWDENTCSIVLEAEHYAGHVAVSSQPSSFSYCPPLPTPNRN